MAGFITMAQAVMNVTGGVPVQPAGSNTVIEKLRAAKSMIPGDMGGMISKIMSGGPAAILQNPMQAVQGAMGGQLGSIVGKIGSFGQFGIPNFGNLSSATGLLKAITGTGGLQQVLGRLNSVTSALSGLTEPAQGMFGLMAASGHANVVSMIPNHPPEIGIEAAMKPLLIEDRVKQMVARLVEIEALVQAGQMSDAAAAAEISAFTDEIAAVLNASDYAFNTVQSKVMEIAQFSAIVSMIASGPDELKPIANMIIQDQHKAEIQEAMDEQIRQ